MMNEEYNSFQDRQDAVRYIYKMHDRIKELEQENAELKDKINLKGIKTTKHDKLTFAEALQLLQEGTAQKISCWNANIYVFYADCVSSIIHAQHSLCRNSHNKFLFCKTARGDCVVWQPNNYEMLHASWHVIE